MELLGHVVLLIGVACLLAAPFLFVSVRVLTWQFGRAVRAVNPDLWESMRPGLNSSAIQQRRRTRRLREFLWTREYADLNRPEITRLGNACLRVAWALLITMFVAGATILTSLKYG